MQQMVYDQAPYHILYYPSQLDAYRTDRFGGWQNQPSQNGTPLFQFGPIDYTLLTDASAPVATPSASAAASGAASAAPNEASVATVAPSPSQAPNAPAAGSGSTPLLLVGIVLLVAAAAIGLFMLRRGRRSAEEE